MVDRIMQSFEEKEDMDAPVGCVAVHIGIAHIAFNNNNINIACNFLMCKCEIIL